MIKTEQEYREINKQLDAIIAKGTQLGDMELLSQEDKNEYIRLSSLIRKWEKDNYPFPIAPNPLLAEIQLQMASKQLKQKEAATLLGIDESRMSEIMRGKRHISMPLAKRIMEKLNIPADMIITYA